MILRDPTEKQCSGSAQSTKTLVGTILRTLEEEVLDESLEANEDGHPGRK